MKFNGNSHLELKKCPPLWCIYNKLPYLGNVHAEIKQKTVNCSMRQILM